MKTATTFCNVVVLLLASTSLADDGKWQTIFDGKSLDGWKSADHDECFTVKDGAIVAGGGPMAHLFYVGPFSDHDFKDFELKVEVMTKPGSNGGIFFHTTPQSGFLKKGYEAQISNTHTDKRRTGSLLIIKDILDTSPVKDDEWFEYHVIVSGKRIVLKVNGKTTVDYTEPDHPERPKGREHRVLSHGMIAFQAHDPNSTVYYRNIRIKVAEEIGNKASVADWTSTFDVDKNNLVSVGKNPYFILEPGYTLHYESEDETLKITVLPETKVVDGVETRVVEEREEKNGKLVEISRNYFAIDKTTKAVYYFGEDVDIYKNGKVVSHEGAWLSGVDGAKFGMMMPGAPEKGDKFYQEHAPKKAMDRCEIIATDVEFKTPAGDFKNCLRAKETSAIESGASYKLYAPGVGLIKDEDCVLVKVVKGKHAKTDTGASDNE